VLNWSVGGALCYLSGSGEVLKILQEQGLSLEETTDFIAAALPVAES